MLMRVFNASRSLWLLIALLVPLSSCANSPLGQSLQDSLAADPRLSQANSPSPGGSPTPTTPSTPTASPSIAPSPQTSSVDRIPSFSESTSVGASGNSAGQTDVAVSTPSSPAIEVQPITFTDFNTTPAPLKPYISDLAKLGILTPAANPKPGATSQPLLKPNQNITRREFARWLVNSNNLLNRDRAPYQVRPAVETAEPAFKDISRKDPDFAIIQGLAEAGIIPSRLSGDGNTNATFRPNEPLTRETLLQWKVPMDVRQSLPNANIENVKQTWGFQDASKINGAALKAVLADYQNGDQANIRRAFGYTTLFQPKKPVTRAEAAASLWYFGYQGEGRSAQQALQPPSSPETATEPSPQTSPTEPSAP